MKMRLPINTRAQWWFRMDRFGLALHPPTVSRAPPTFCHSTITLIPIKRPIEPSMVHETTTKDIGEKYPSIHLLDSNFAPYIIIFELTCEQRNWFLFPGFSKFSKFWNSIHRGNWIFYRKKKKQVRYGSIWITFHSMVFMTSTNDIRGKMIKVGRTMILDWMERREFLLEFRDENNIVRIFSTCYPFSVTIPFNLFRIVTLLEVASKEKWYDLRIYFSLLLYDGILTNTRKLSITISMGGGNRVPLKVAKLQQCQS